MGKAVLRTAEQNLTQEEYEEFEEEAFDSDSDQE